MAVLSTQLYAGETMIPTGIHSHTSNQPRFVQTIHFVLLLLGLLAVPGTVSAQHDIRLSTEPLSLILPDYAKIQSAGRIGGRTLVVWGTTRKTSDTSAASMLVMQMLQDTTPIGSPVTLTSPDARPFDFVQVLPLRDRFLVVWNDRRDGDSVAFMQRVDSAGGLIGSEELLTTEPVDSFGILKLEMIGGYKLVWNGQGAYRNLILSRETDTAATFLRPLYTALAGTLRQALSPSLLPGITLIMRDARTPLIYRIDGTIDTLRGEAARHFTIPYYLDPDGSLVTLENRGARFYYTLFDTVAYRIVQTPAGTGTNAGTWLITKDSTGSVMLLWATGGDGTFFGMYGDAGLIEMGVYSSRLTSADTLEPQKLVKAITLDWLTYRYTQLRTYMGAKQIRGCGNQYRIEMYFDVQTRFSYLQEDTTYYGKDTASFNIDGSGRVWGESDAFSQESLNGLPLADLCPDSPEIPIIRIPSKTASEITVKLSDNSIRLSAPVAFVAINVPQQTPCLSNYSGALLVSWYSLATDSLCTLGRWNITAPTPVDSIAAITYNDLPGTSKQIFGLTGTGSLTQLGNTFLINSLLSWQEKTQPGDSLITHRQYLLHMPTDTGWRLVKRIESPLAVNYPFTVYRYGYNPEDGTIIGTIGSGSSGDGPVSVRAFAIDTKGQSLWDFDSIFSAYRGWWISTVPVSGDEFIFFNAGTGIHFKGRDTVRKFDLPGLGAHDYPVYSRLAGNHFMRSPMGGNRSLELFDLDGNSLASSFIAAPSTQYDLTWLQDPADSGFVVLWGSDTGVWMNWLDKQLNVIRSNIPVSEQVAPARHPAAVFRNDTLYVVWEDYRNGASDIYGTSLYLKTLLEVAPRVEASTTDQVIRIAPNPALDVLTISLPSDNPTPLSIVDSYGDTHLRTSISSPHATIDIRTLPTGTYRVVVFSNGRQRVVPLVVLR